MSDKHPIDDLFRQALTGAAVAPPAELGRAILAQVQAQRRRALLWRRRALAVVLLILGSGAAWTWFASGPIEERAIVEGSTAKSGSAVSEMLNSGAVDSAADGLPLGMAKVEAELRHEGARHHHVPSASVEGPEQESHDGPNVSATEKSGSTDVADEQRIDAATRYQDGSETSEAVADEHFSTSEPLPDARAEFMDLRAADLTAPMSTGILITADGVEYYSPRGYWWLGLGVTAQAGRYRWGGDSEKLARALEGKGQWNPGFAYGICAGRGWPSGLSLGLGLEMERSEQSYRNVERATVRHVETVEQVVVLNTHVFTTDITTTEVQEERESIAEGKDVRTRLRIPVEVSWGLRRGRWMSAPRLGFIAEQTQVRSSSSLALDPEDGMVRARSLSDAELRHRYPLSFSGFAGIDIGYSLSEGFTVLATPFYSKALFTTSSGSDALAFPERAGLRLQIQHRF